MGDLIERLRNFEGSDALGNGDFSLLHEAAAALEAARAEVVKLRNLRADAIHECALANVRAELMAEALEEIRSRSSMNLAMQPDPFELTARLGDIYQIADAMLKAREASSD